MSDADLTEQIARVIAKGWRNQRLHEQTAAAIVEQVIPQVRAEALREAATRMRAAHGDWHPSCPDCRAADDIWREADSREG